MPSRQISLACLTAEQGCAAPSVEEQVLAFGNILDVNLSATVHSCEDALLLLAEKLSPAGLGSAIGRSPCWRQKLQTVPQADPHPVFRNFVNGRVGN